MQNRNNQYTGFVFHLIERSIILDMQTCDYERLLMKVLYSKNCLNYASSQNHPYIS